MQGAAREVGMKVRRKEGGEGRGRMAGGLNSKLGS